MAKCFHLSIITTGGKLLDGEAEYCNFPISDGSIGVLANHAPMLCALREGETLCRMEDGSEKRIRHSAGVANVHDNKVMILADRAEL